MNMLAFTRKFPRIAKQLRYTRKFVPSNVMKITIPWGIPYEAFDHTGSTVTPWSLLQLFESARTFAFWEVSHAERQNESFVDTHKLLENNFMFVATAKLEINQNLYNCSNLKYPLSITNVLDYVGKSSMNVTSSLQQLDLEIPYAVFQLQKVLVDPETRKAAPFPDWWRQKYETNAIGGKPLIMKPLQEENSTHVHHCPITVFHRDTDSYNHTNWMSYIRYCTDACDLMVMKNLYKNLNQDKVNNGVKNFEISFRKESVAGDILDVASWEHANDDHTLNFRVSKGGNICTESTMTFFDSKPNTNL